MADSFLKVAKHLIEQRKMQNRERAIANTNAVTLDNLFDKMVEMKNINYVYNTQVRKNTKK